MRIFKLNTNINLLPLVIIKINNSLLLSHFIKHIPNIVFQLEILMFAYDDSLIRQVIHSFLLSEKF